MMGGRSKIVIGALVLVALSGAAGALLGTHLYGSATQQFLINNITIGAIIAAVAFALNWRRDQLTLASAVNKQFQDYNLAILRDERLAGLISKNTFKERSAEWIQRVAAVFYLLNIVRDSLTLQRRFYAREKEVFRCNEIIEILAEDYPEQLQYVLQGRRGYHQDFIDYVWITLEKNPKWSRLRTQAHAGC